MDSIDIGLTLAEEAIRDIVRERGVTRAEAARIALAGMDAWVSGSVPPNRWPTVLAAAEQHLRESR